MSYVDTIDSQLVGSGIARRARDSLWHNRIGIPRADARNPGHVLWRVCAGGWRYFPSPGINSIAGKV